MVKRLLLSNDRRNEEMKKVYMTPEVEIVNLNIQSSLMAGSLKGNGKYQEDVTLPADEYYDFEDEEDEE